MAIIRWIKNLISIIHSYTRGDAVLIFKKDKGPAQGDTITVKTNAGQFIAAFRKVDSKVVSIEPGNTGMG